MDQAGHNADSYQRVEVITGRRRRRDWSSEEKARILAESADPAVNVSEVARRNGVSRGLLNIWRRQARLASAAPAPFAQVKIDDGIDAGPVTIGRNRVLAGPAERIEIVIAGATVRVPTDADGPTLERVLAALRSTR
jgi:transposase